MNADTIIIAAAILASQGIEASTAVAEAFKILDEAKIQAKRRFETESKYVEKT